MKKFTLTLLTLTAIIALLAGCTRALIDTPASDAGNAEVTLEITNGEQSVTLTWDQILDMPAYTGIGGRISSVGTITPPRAPSRILPMPPTAAACSVVLTTTATSIP